MKEKMQEMSNPVFLEKLEKITNLSVVCWISPESGKAYC